MYLKTKKMNERKKTCIQHKNGVSCAICAKL